MGNIWKYHEISWCDLAGRWEILYQWRLKQLAKWNLAILPNGWDRSSSKKIVNHHPMWFPRCKPNRINHSQSITMLMGGKIITIGMIALWQLWQPVNPTQRVNHHAVERDGPSNYHRYKVTNKQRVTNRFNIFIHISILSIISNHFHCFPSDFP